MTTDKAMVTEPVAALVVDRTGCEHMSPNIALIERIAADCGERPTYLYSTLSKRGEVEETRAPENHLEGVYVIPREMTDEEWSEVKYNVDRKADPDIPLWRVQEAVKYANHIAGHRGRKMIETPSPQSNVERDYPAEFEAWWETYRHKNRDPADYSVKKQIAFDAFYFGAQTPSPSPRAAAPIDPNDPNLEGRN